MVLVSCIRDAQLATIRDTVVAGVSSGVQRVLIIQDTIVVAFRDHRDPIGGRQRRKLSVNAGGIRRRGREPHA